MPGNQFLVIAGSTRQMRRSPAIAAWVAAVGNRLESEAFRAIDLRDLELGLDDEPGIPAMGGEYLSASTRRWSELVRSARGVVFVSPQYNWGYPAALKNAIDHLFLEWRGKPSLVVTYGSQGGDKCAAQLREVLTGIGVRLTDAMPWLRLSRERIMANDGEVDPEADFEDQREALQSALLELLSVAPAG